MRIDSEWIELPGGEFEMGQDDASEDERPVHRVALERFTISRCQVTNADFDLFVHASGRPAGEYRSRPEFLLPLQPVVAVNWFDAVGFCNWAARQTGRAVRLPTEAEWEYAARGGRSGCLYPWGSTAADERRSYARRWLRGPEPVGTAEANGFGLCDMCENVREWCADWYDARYYGASPVENPGGPERGTARVARGGSWRSHAKLARCAARGSLQPAFRRSDFGFRVVCDGR